MVLILIFHLLKLLLSLYDLRIKTQETGFLWVSATVMQYSRKNPVSDHPCVSPIAFILNLPIAPTQIYRHIQVKIC
ncbi:hypothetical protein [Microcoleus sp. CAWBG27]|uniref:hypothetical protein n=1 Tax=Microcoleus sp. CAWBG27 TaxID=2841645 RepID=UPI0025E1C72B|nr:hypothetical protein [Microcoleus sp. CAWBG27]